MDVKNISSLSIKKLINSYKITEKSAIEYMNAVKKGSTTLQEGKTHLQGYQLYLKATGNSLNLATLKTNAFSVATKALSTIGWTVAISAATFAVEKLIGFFV